MMITTYRVIEVQPEDEKSIEDALNTNVKDGWEFDRITFVQQPGVRRPSMAYIFFTRQTPAEAETP